MPHLRDPPNLNLVPWLFSVIPPLLSLAALTTNGNAGVIWASLFAVCVLPRKQELGLPIYFLLIALSLVFGRCSKIPVESECVLGQYVSVPQFPCL